MSNLTAIAKLRFAFLEIGATWLPYYLDRLDEHWEKRAVIEMPLLKDRRLRRRGSFSFRVGHPALGLRVPRQSRASAQPPGAVRGGQRKDPVQERQAAL
jgi:hypothetical protein